MQYHELNASKRKSDKRVGRGISSGQGKTAGRGTKGQSSRAGGKRSPGFEGGQNPLMMRLPKLRGFKSKKQPTENVYTGQLDNFKGKIDNYKLFEANLITTPYTNVKVINKGELKNKVEVNLQAASQSSIEMIQKAGGTFNKVAKPMRKPKEKPAKK